MSLAALKVGSIVGAPNDMSLAVLKATCHAAGQLTRAAVELAKLWRNDKYLRKLDVRQHEEHATKMYS